RFTPDGTGILTGDRTGTLTMWDASTGARINDYPLHDGGLWFAEYSPDYTRIVTMGFDRIARILDAETFEVLAETPQMEQISRGVAVSPDGQRFVTTGRDGRLRFWSMKDAALLTEARSQAGRFFDADFSADA